MEILCFSGIPGSGKTLDATYEALRHYKKENNELKKIVIYLLAKLPGKIGNKARIKKSYYEFFPYGKINTIYSNYPILLDKKLNIYSYKWDLYSFNNKWSYLPNAMFIQDEIQLLVDSDEYADTSKKYKIAYIARFMQSARHFGCKSIILCTQHPSRLFKKGRNVSSEFVKHSRIFKIPFLNIGFIKRISYYTLDDYGKFIPKHKEARKQLSFDFKKKTRFVNFNKVFNSYDSRYLSNYNFRKPLYSLDTYTSKKVDYDDLVVLFEGDN